MPVIATAGHVDHGKSALIEALTGRNPDRLGEEKRRGLTIDLGFAWTTLPSGCSVAFVDVPGHQRFIGNMLAGVGSVSSALLIVAADEGWKPQTEEHLAVLDLLDTKRVLVALTKIDLANEVSLLMADIRKRLVGTVAQDAQIIPVSVRSGRGLDDLREALDHIAVDPDDVGRPQIWVDRAFVVAGAGIVVTGTLLGGSLGTGDEVAIWPGDLAARVRSVESHERKQDRVAPGNRIGVNLAGLGRGDVERGARIALPGSMRSTSRIQVTLRLPRYVSELGERGDYHLHVGTASVAATLRPLDKEHALVDLAHPLWLQAGDRFVVRDSGRRLVIAGGMVLDPAPVGRRSEIASRSLRLAEAVQGGPDQVATALLEARGRARQADLAAWSGGGHADAIGESELLLSSGKAAELAGEAVVAVDQHHQSRPLEEGLSLGRLASLLEVDEPLARTIVALTASLELRGSAVAARGSAPQEIDERWQSLATTLQTAAPPTLDELGVDSELIRRLLRDGQLVRVADNLVYLPASLEEVIATVRAIDAPFTVSEFRRLLGITRKHAVPLLEYFDREGITLRTGDQRTAR
ncbi:MAG: selenocysteine-specific translation elongation factor [Acidimicrobiia bacterium]|nr:selenocysteine-specific translation elongation factor [Acidimicrobiia bacterium]